MPVDPGSKPPVPAPPTDRSFTASLNEARAASQGARNILMHFHTLIGGRGR